VKLNRTIEDFQDPNEDEEIIRVRFNHYLARYNRNGENSFSHHF